MKTIISNLIPAIQEFTGTYVYLNEAKGLSEMEIDSMERELQVKLPEDFREALQVYGLTVPHPRHKRLVISIPHFGNMGLMSRDQILASFNLLMAEDGSLESQHQIEGLEKIYWNKKWIPVSSGNRSYIDDVVYQYDMLVLDENSSHYGKIIFWTASDGPVRISAESFADYIEDFSNALNSTLLEWDEDYGFSF